MIANDPNVLVIELAALSLEPILDDFVLVGGCAVGMLVTDAGRPPIRGTIDVDLIVEITSHRDYYTLAKKLKSLGFEESKELIYRHTKGPLIIDVIPTDGSILGFSNQWYEAAARECVSQTLPSGREIRHVSGPYMLASKLDAFNGRGEGDYLHHDIEDIVNLVDGRPELAREVDSSGGDVRSYIREQFDELLSDQVFIEALPLHFHPSDDHGVRLPLLLSRLRQLAGL